MVQQSGSKEKLDVFIESRRDAKSVYASKLVVDANEVRKLDTHLIAFLKQLRADAKVHERSALKIHAKAFEDEIHAELSILFERTKQDLLLYQKTLKALSDYRLELKGMVDDPSLSHLAESELNYADLLVKTAGEKISTLSLLFKKLKR